MQTKIYTIDNLGCANCAAKMEQKMNALPQVQEAAIVFATRQLRITAQDPDGLLSQLQQIVSSIEPDAKIVETHDGHHHETCHCHDCHGHHHHEQHHEHHHHGHAHRESTLPLLLGGGLFALGLLLGALHIPFGSETAYIAAYLLLGHQVLTTAAKNMIKGHVFDENFLMSVATLGAFCIGEFPEAVGVMLFYRVGEYFEHKAVERSRSQIMEAVDLRPEVVTLADGRTIPAGQAKVGELLLIRPGDRIPLDGRVVSGESRIDTAPITGEPVPVGVQPGDPVISGCVNTVGQLTVQVEKELGQSMVSRILEAVENAAAGKPKIDRFITRFSRVYTPVVVAVAALTAIVPSIITGDWGYWVYTALSFLVMSCPCALVLSVPLTFFSGIGVGSRKGILFKGGASMEAMAAIKAVAMDKTGTVTRGDFQVREVRGGQSLLYVAASCEQRSTHPIAESITAYASNIPLGQPESLQELPGRGIVARLDGKQVLCGNEALLGSYGVEVSKPQEPGTVVHVAADGAYLGYLRISDALKPGAAEAVKRLDAMGLQTAMLTGDNEENARAVAREAGIRQVRARLLPEQKLTALTELRKRWGSILFVGDGINDAPVLAGADVGAAMGSGADAAIEAADVVFLTSDIRAVPEALEIARRTQRTAWQNVVFALAVKAAVMVLGLLGFASMWLAVFADSGVAMLCVLHAVSMLYRKK